MDDIEQLHKENAELRAALTQVNAVASSMAVTLERAKPIAPWCDDTILQGLFDTMFTLAKVLMRQCENNGANTMEETVTDARAKEIMIAMRGHMDIWGAAKENHQVLDIENDSAAGYPEFAGECIRFIAAQIGATTPQPAVAAERKPAVWLTLDGKAYGSVSDEQVEAVLLNALHDVRQRSGLDRYARA